MDLEFSYMLYFKREHLWHALQAVMDMTAPHQPPTQILSPDHELFVPLDAQSVQSGAINFNDPILYLTTSLYFPEDAAIQAYLGEQKEAVFRSPPDQAGIRRVSIGIIYLQIYTRLPWWISVDKNEDLVLFDFATPGTSLSLLFQESPSIRKVFVELLEKVSGVCGVFNQEDNGLLFWFNGQGYADLEVEDPNTPPDEIETLLGI